MWNSILKQVSLLPYRQPEVVDCCYVKKRIYAVSCNYPVQILAEALSLPYKARLKMEPEETEYFL
jgi:hypothetical protein